MDVGIQMVFASYGWDDGISDVLTQKSECHPAKAGIQLGRITVE
jgi:hypothetical protein